MATSAVGFGRVEAGKARRIFMSPEDFAEATGLSVHTVRQMVRDRKIAATRTSPGKGGSVLILASEIDRLVAEAEAWRAREDDAPDFKDDDLDEQDNERTPKPIKAAARKRATRNR